MKALLRLTFALAFVFSFLMTHAQEYELGVLDLNDGNDTIFIVNTALGKLFYEKNDELFACDGTVENSYSVGHADTATSFYPYHLINGHQLYIVQGLKCYTTDGSPGSLILLSDSIRLTTGIFYEGEYILNTQLYFFGQSIYTGKKYLMRTDGTKEGTETLMEMGVNGVPDVHEKYAPLEIFGNEIYFLGGYPDSSFASSFIYSELWKTDGTTNGTTLISTFEADEPIGSYNSYVSLSGLISVGDRLLFNRTSYNFSDTIFDINTELWTTNGTEVDMYELLDIGLGNPQYYNNKNYIVFQNDLSGLWLTDGYLEGTFDLLADTDSASYVYEYEVFDDKIAFNVVNNNQEGDVEFEPWISGGTLEETHMLKNISESSYSGPSNFTNLGSRVAFGCYNMPEQVIWISDGTEENTLSMGNFASVFETPFGFTAYRGRLYFTAENYTFGKTIHYLELEPNPNISGKIYHDLNDNGQWDNDEPGIPGLPVVADGGAPLYTFTREDGSYQFSVRDSNNYIVRYLDQAHCWVPTSFPGYYEVEVADTAYENLDFGLRRLQGPETAYLDIQSGATRCNFTVPFWFNIYNTGCEPISGNVIIDLDEQVTLQNFDEENVSVDGDQLIWSFDSIPVSGSQQLDIQLRMPGTDAIGDTIAIIANALIEQADTSYAANTFVYESEITCAYDPNDKLVRPNRQEPSNSNYTQIDETLYYTVRFQNTGNDTAFTVRILDQLSSELEWESFQPLSSSHDYKATLFPDGEVEFLFENILLPDSTTNLIGSQGYVAFSIRAKEGLEDFTTISNTAGIYFDYNEPIITNTVTNTMVAFLDFDQDGFPFWEDCNDENAVINPDAAEIINNEVDEDCDGEISVVSVHSQAAQMFSIYPNPTSGELFIEYEGASFAYEIYTPLGNMLLQHETLNTNTAIVDISDLPTGVYFIRLNDPRNGKMRVKRIVKN